jgi:hypothetical protein
MELSQVRLKRLWRRNRKYFKGLMARKQGAAVSSLIGMTAVRAAIRLLGTSVGTSRISTAA